MIRNALAAAVLAALGVVFSTSNAYAYLDPGTASMVLQGIIGGIAAAIAAGTFYWQRVKQFAARVFRRGGNGRVRAAASEDD